MFIVKNLLCLILLHLVISSPQINLHLTDWISNNKSDVVFQHDCLYVAATIEKETDPHEIISYCLTEWSSKWNIQQNNYHQKLTFAELLKQNITSQQLYLWSASMDVVERYQFYLNQLSILNQSSLLEKSLFYNCTSPRFGSQCQFSLDNHKSYYSSINEIIYDFYQYNYDPINLTCYTHLKCNRGSTLICLDWTEICDGTRDCQDGIDEESCWQFRFNDCEENEYQCRNGQCISNIFLYDRNGYECLDKTDETRRNTLRLVVFLNIYDRVPTFTNEDIVCPERYDSSNIKLTSSCLRKRNIIIEELLFVDKLNGTTDDCWMAFKCHLQIQNFMGSRCHVHCPSETCKSIINEICPDMLSTPAATIAFGHMFFVYNKNMSLSAAYIQEPHYICYDDQLCDGFAPNKSLISFNNATCRRPDDFPLKFNSAALFRNNWYQMYVLPVYQSLSQCNKIISNDSASCNNLTMYRCINSSKCISKDQLCDYTSDCDYGDDEGCPLINGSCSAYGVENIFACTINNICISQTLITDGWCHCGYDESKFCDDENLDIYYSKTRISFGTICDGFTELLPIIINGQNETDETECEYWPCNNTYTRCDGFWNCFNGADEVNCNSLSSLLNCPNHHHICVSPLTNQFMCLPLEKANDGNIDCLGGTDEPKLCRSNNHHVSHTNFYCNTYSEDGCISSKCLRCSSNCKDTSDGQFCDKTRNITGCKNFCTKENEIIRSDVENFFCTRQVDRDKLKIKNFSLEKLTNSTNYTVQERTNTIISYSSIRQTATQKPQQRCHRGLPLRVWLDDDDQNLYTTACLCPSSFYGHMCQYQNQRISLTMQFQTFSDSRRTVFAVIVSLIDDSNERIIHSYEQLTYLYIRNCQTKFNVYLLYSTRPKHSGKHYSLHIDIYEKISLTYRSSMIIPIKFSFLPVYRSAVHLTIPGIENSKESCSDPKCIHGQCVRYSNDKNSNSFCQCNEEWSGKYCTIQHKCTCSLGSLCLGILATNRSICVCPFNKWGSQCFLDSTICNSSGNGTCYNDGQCIPIDENIASVKQFLCICRKGFSGERCEIPDNKIILSFDKDITLSETIVVHFIRVINNGPPENGSTFKTILTNRTLITIEWLHPFHIAFLEMVDNYYLIIVQKIFNGSKIIVRKISSSDRCQHISEVLNETIANLHLLRRIKYYHLACQKHSLLLSCFYDDNHFCLCNDYGDKRVANCFEFNSSIEHNCFSSTTCKNGAQCLQDRPFCPQRSICVCPKCFYGAQCQFSSNLFDLSFDGLLGYYIQPNINLKYQPSIIQFSVALTTFMIIAGFINSILSIITFKNEQPRKLGCGVYLLASSIINFITMITFTLKFWILIIAQMSYITNRSFLYIQCISFDFLLRISLSMNQWMSASVAMERAFTLIKGTSFDQNKSKKMAKYIIFAFLFFTIITNIQGPISRRLFDEYDDDIDRNRIWCIVNYSHRLRTFNSVIVMFHFFAPFFINIISAIIIIVMGARQQTTVHTHQPYRKLLHKQFKQHFHLLISPICLVICALPHIIISFASGCMKSISGSWLFFIAYLISFVPSMLTFLVFVIPSKTYKQVFQNTLKQYRNKIQRLFHSD